jgi:hypothetical protein
MQHRSDPRRDQRMDSATPYTTPRMTALHMLRSTIETVSAPPSSSFRGSLPRDRTINSGDPASPECSFQARDSSAPRWTKRQEGIFRHILRELHVPRASPLLVCSCLPDPDLTTCLGCRPITFYGRDPVLARRLCSAGFVP